MTTSANFTSRMIELIKKGQEPEDKENPIYKRLKDLYLLGDNDFIEGYRIFRKLERDLQIAQNPNGWIYHNLLLRGTPSQFAKFIERLNDRMFHEPNDKTKLLSPFKIIKTDDLEAEIELSPYFDIESAIPEPYAIITAISHPDGCNVELKVIPINWEGVKEYWENLITVLQKEKLMQENGELITYRNKGGAPRKEDYDHAWSEMKTGVSLDLAYQHYLERYGMKPEKSVKDSFRNAMKRRQNIAT